MEAAPRRRPGGTAAGDRARAVPLLSSSRAAVLLAALIGAVITLAGFTFWMPSLMVQLVSRHVSPRVLSVYLADRSQQRLLGNSWRGPSSTSCWCPSR